MTRKQKFVQKGGMHGTPLPAEVFGTNSGRYHPTGASALNMSGSAWGANVPTSRGTIIADNLMGPELGATKHSGMQTGGARRKSKNNNRRRSQKNQNRAKNNNRRRSQKNQNGGNPFQKITNPETGRAVNIHGAIGRKVLMNYLKH
tara:strand:- start:1488 stop:1925 length:438 start_codon:yes stop_codon:yes gene_type:complete